MEVCGFPGVATKWGRRSKISFIREQERMRSFGSMLIGAAVFSLGLTSGCGQPTATGCPRAIGTFTGTYTFISGTCEPTFQARSLDLQEDAAGDTTNTTKTLSDAVTTEINLSGCTIGMTQMVTDPDGTHLISQVRGQLAVEDESALAGMMSRTDYMPDGVAIRCTAQYNATYTLDGTAATTTLGAAAQHALENP
jgi:hypothetical protein